MRKNAVRKGTGRRRWAALARHSGAAAAGVGFAALLALSGFAGGPAAEHRTPVALAKLVPASDPLSAQDLTFDARFAEEALAYLDSADPGLFKTLTAEPAVAHILRHARHYDYDVPKESAEALVRSLLAGETSRGERAATCRASLAYFTGPMLDDPGWVADALRYLPKDFRYHGSLFLTFGYDIGVALAPSASLNGAQRHFAGHLRELVYYGIHELHHVGFQTIQPPPRIDSLKTCADVRRFVDYATQMEGMAVWAAYERRRVENALDADGDYIALRDEARMRSYEAEYREVYEGLARRGDAPADDAARGVISKMSGERLWYRVGARMAAAIEKVRGREALVELVRQGPARFKEAFERLGGTR